MAYPKNDTDFAEGCVQWVLDEGTYIKVGYLITTVGNGAGFEGCEFYRKPSFQIREGNRIRIYSFMSFGRGVYIAGRTVEPYRTYQQRMEEDRKRMKKMFEQLDDIW